MIARRTDALILTALSAIAITSASLAQTTAPAPAAPVATPEVPTSTQPFVGSVTADKVYVRSGPGGAYYELGHLSKGDTVHVVGSRLGWYQILPPNGTYCMIAKEFVEADANGESGTVKADYVNVRAGTALNKSREPSAVLTVVRKGTKLSILGSTDKYYEVAPPEKAYVYIAPQFVKAAEAGTEYKIPDLKVPVGAGPSKATVTSVPTIQPTATVDMVPTTPTTPTTPTNPVTPANTDTQTPAGTNVAETQPAPVLPRPATTYSDTIVTRYNDLNSRYQAELDKPVGKRDGLDALIKDYKDLLASKESIPPSVKQGTDARIEMLTKLATIQRLQKEAATAAEDTAKQTKAYQERYADAAKALEEYENSGPYLATGTLQTSATVQGKYALVNPVTGRTEAYLDPKSAIDIGSLMGKYIGVRGVTKKATDADITVIQVKNATLLPAPQVPTKNP